MKKIMAIAVLFFIVMSAAAAFAGPANPGPAGPGPENQEPVKPGPAKPGPAKPGPVKPGPANPGAAKPGPANMREFTLRQPDGFTFMARQCGDERFHWIETVPDAYVVIKDGGRWMFAVSRDGRMVPSKVMYRDRVKPPRDAIQKFSPAPGMKKKF